MDNYDYVCVDCLMAIVNDDYTGIDDEQRYQEVKQGVERFGNHAYIDGHDDEFNVNPCACCGTPLAGQRFAMEEIKC